MEKTKKKKKGFTLIELLVVISIISLLASIFVASARTVQGRAQVSRLVEDAHTIQIQIDIARLTSGMVVGELTGTFCSSCGFVYGQDMSEPHWAIDLILKPSWEKLGFAGVPRDPWGNPYILQEKEHLSGSNDCVHHDQVYSAGNNGLFESPNMKSTAPPGVVVPGGGDDYIFAITFFTCGES